MKTLRAKKIRLRPTKEQEKQMWASSSTARWAFNWVLSIQDVNHRLGNKFISNNDLRKHITKMKQRPEYAWLYNVSNNVTKQSVKDACDAYKKWFTSIKGKSDLKVNKPIFKSKNKTKPSFYNDNFNLRVKTKKVLIEKVGWVKTSEQIPINTKYHNPRISFDNKYWYISVGIEKDISPQKLTNETLGIDIGIKNLATLSTGKFYENINKKISIKNLEKKLKRLQRQVSRKYDMNKDGKKFVKTSNIRKLENKIRLIHRKLANIRQNYLHQTTTKIVKTKPSKIVVEKLNVKGMMRNKHLAKSIAQQKFYEFKRQLKYKCEEYGINLLEADKFFPSSKICHRCGNKKENLKLSHRIYHCDECGYEIDRDLNAALNLSDYIE